MRDSKADILDEIDDLLNDDLTPTTVDLSSLMVKRTVDVIDPGDSSARRIVDIEPNRFI